MLIFLASLNLLNEACIDGVNCPLNQGACQGDICACSNGYWTLLDTNIPMENQTYCNYEKINSFAPFIMEVFLPSVGHFYVGKYYCGIIKLTLLIIFVSTSIALYNKVTLPPCLLKLASLFGLSPDQIFDSQGNEGNGVPFVFGDDQNKEENTKKQEIHFTFVMNKKDMPSDNTGRGLASRKRQRLDEDEKNNENQEITNIGEEENLLPPEPVFDKENYKGSHVNKPNVIPAKKKTIQEIQKEEEEKIEKENKSISQKILVILNAISGVIISLIYITDIICYKQKIYKDGNGVPFE